MIQTLSVAFTFSDFFYCFILFLSRFNLTYVLSSIAIKRTHVPTRVVIVKCICSHSPTAPANTATLTRYCSRWRGRCRCWDGNNVSIAHSPLTHIHTPTPQYRVNARAQNYNASLKLRRLKLSIDFAGCEKKSNWFKSKKFHFFL